VSTDGAFSIGMKDVYDELKQLSGQVSTVTIELKHLNESLSRANERSNDHETRLRAIEKWQDALEIADKRATDHETRIRTMEKWQNAIPATIFTALASAIAALLMFFFGNGK